MRFSLQDVKKSIQRRGGELAVSLHFLRPGELEQEITRLIAYHERLLGEPQRFFSLDDARAYVGDYRLAHCLLATLSHWYSWQTRDWATVVRELNATLEFIDFTSATDLRLALYTYVNEQYHGFLTAAQRTQVLQGFATRYQLDSAALEYLLVLDKDEEALLVRTSEQPPTALDVTTLYNQWVFEAALFNASDVQFVVDCQAFSTHLDQQEASVRRASTPAMGVGAVIKRLCFLARKLGVYYDLAYEDTLVAAQTPALLTLTLYGPQEVTGAPQQYGLRLARLCRMLLGYSGAASGKQRANLSAGMIEATATVHFLQRSYRFAMNARLLQLLPAAEAPAGAARALAPDLFDSSIEQAFSEEFMALAASQGVDGWQLEREPEPLLLEHSIFIPDFAMTRGRQRIYVEILGFWTPSYRERKIQKLQQLQGRENLLLALPLEARDAFRSVCETFPVVVYRGQLAATDVLQVLRSRYDDFAERLRLLDGAEVRQRVRAAGLLPERVCYQLLHCYRRSELQSAADHVLTDDSDDLQFVPGVGLYRQSWEAQVKARLLAWLAGTAQAGSIPLSEALGWLQGALTVEVDIEVSALEILITRWPEVTIRRDSLFAAMLELAASDEQNENVQNEVGPEGELLSNEGKKKRRKSAGREPRTGGKRRGVVEPGPKQDELWG